MTSLFKTHSHTKHGSLSKQNIESEADFEPSAPIRAMTGMFKTLSHSNQSAKCSVPIDKKDDAKPVEDSKESRVNSDNVSFEPKPLARAKTSFFTPHIHSHSNYADGSKSDDEGDEVSFSAPHHSKPTLFNPPSRTNTSTSPLTPPSTPSLPHKIHHITTLSSLEAVLEEHYHQHVVIFCVLSTHKDPDVDEEGWYHHYERLNNVHFVRIDLETDTEDDGVEELEERLGMKGRGKPCWVTFHKGCLTGWASGGMKKFMRVHGGRGHANSI
jgi:hypothetical protein